MMEIYDEQMRRIEQPDLTLGYLKDGVRTVTHAAVEAQAEQWHYETVREYENGGRDLRRVTDVPGRAAKAAWTQEIPIQIYVAYTQQELEEIRKKQEQPALEDRVAEIERTMRALSAQLEAGLRLLAERGKDIGKEDGEDDQLALHDAQPVSQ